MACLLAFSVTGVADTIFRTDGPPIEDCKVRTEDSKVVKYRDDGGDKQEIDSDKVVRIEYERLPKLLDRARTALTDEDFIGAITEIEDYLDATSEKGDSKSPWAPAYARFWLIELQSSIGDLESLVKSADKLIESESDSLYMPLAYLAKADALTDLGKGADARGALTDLQAKVDEQGLSQRWKLEAELSLSLADGKLKGDKLRDKLSSVADEADSYPTVLNRAKLAEAESFLEEKEFSAAETILSRTIDSGKADERTMAGAYTGLGDCQFQRAVDLFKEEKKDEAEALLLDAVLSYMRVVEVYPGQSRYVAKSMFFAGRAFEQLQDDISQARAKRMYREVARQFPNSGWAKEARDFLKGR